MTTFGRYEREIPRLMDELAPARLPDYVDDMLSRTARTSQRPAWASLERWLPMASTTRTLSLRPMSVGGIALILLLLLAMVATAFVVGSRLQTSNPMTSLVIATAADGGLVAINPDTGEATAIGSDSTDATPVISPDGTRLAFLRGPSVVVANLDGSEERILTTLTGGFDPLIAWSPDSAKLMATHQGSVPLAPGQDPVSMLSIIDVVGGTASDLDIGIDVGSGSIWQPGTGQLIVPGRTLADDGTDLFGLWLVNADGSDVRPIVDPVPNETAWMNPTVSPDGRLVAVTVWDAEAGLNGRVRVIDIDTGKVTMPETTSASGDRNEFVRAFSPDGSRLLFGRFYLAADGQDAYRLGIVPVSGGEALLIGPDMGKGQGNVDTAFSPDGSQIIARYQDGSIWLLDAVNGGEGTKVDWPIGGPISWGSVN